MKRRLQMVADAAALAGAMELSHCGGASDCNAPLVSAEVAKELEYAVLATEIAGRKGRRRTLHVEIRSGLKAMAFQGKSLPYALGVSSDSITGNFERDRHVGQT